MMLFNKNKRRINQPFQDAELEAAYTAAERDVARLMRVVPRSVIRLQIAYNTLVGAILAQPLRRLAVRRILLERVHAYAVSNRDKLESGNRLLKAVERECRLSKCAVLVAKKIILLHERKMLFAQADILLSILHTLREHFCDVSLEFDERTAIVGVFRKVQSCAEEIGYILRHGHSRADTSCNFTNHAKILPNPCQPVKCKSGEEKGCEE